MGVWIVNRSWENRGNMSFLIFSLCNASQLARHIVTNLEQDGVDVCFRYDALAFGNDLGI